MDLQEFFNINVGIETVGSLGNTQAWSNLYPLIQSEAHTEPTLAAIFWQIYFESPAFPYQLFRAGASLMVNAQPQTLVVPHGPPSHYDSRYDLLVLDPGFRGDPVKIPVDANERELFEGWARWHSKQYQAWLDRRSRQETIEDEIENNRMIRFITCLENHSSLPQSPLLRN